MRNLDAKLSEEVQYTYKAKRECLNHYLGNQENPQLFAKIHVEIWCWHNLSEYQGPSTHVHNTGTLAEMCNTQISGTNEKIAYW